MQLQCEGKYSSVSHRLPSYTINSPAGGPKAKVNKNKLILICKCAKVTRRGNIGKVVVSNKSGITCTLCGHI